MTQRSVAIVIHAGVQALDVAGPLDVFCEANGFLSQAQAYTTFVIAPTLEPVRASNGLLITPEMDFAQASRVFSTVLVAGGPALPGAATDEALSTWLREWGVKAQRYGSVCTGAFAIGRAGLLDGRTVTTHWQNAHQLAAMFPAALVEHDRIYLRDGPLVTSAGVTAGIDLALALVAEDHGPGVALSCAKRLVVAAQRQGGQSQFSPFLLPPPTPDSPLAKVQAHIAANLAQPLSVERLAEVAAVSSRSLARLFASELGVTPHDFVESVRIDHARNLLEATDRALKVVAYDCGFGSAEQMRVVFQKRLGTTPTRYREMFTLGGATDDLQAAR